MLKKEFSVIFQSAAGRLEDHIWFELYFLN